MTSLSLDCFVGGKFSSKEGNDGFLSEPSNGVKILNGKFDRVLSILMRDSVVV